MKPNKISSNCSDMDDMDQAMTTANELRGRQSVRTTFKLSANIIHAVSLVAAHLGIKQKSLFDHLIDDIRALKPLEITHEKTGKSIDKRIQKTYVVSRKSLDSLERASKVFHTSRDHLVEISVQRLLPMIKNERHQHEKRKKILSEFQAQTAQTKDLWKKTRENLGDNDFVSEKITVAIKILELTELQIAEFIERGKIIETSPLGSD